MDNIRIAKELLHLAKEIISTEDRKLPKDLGNFFKENHINTGIDITARNEIYDENSRYLPSVRNENNQIKTIENNSVFKDILERLKNVYKKNKEDGLAKVFNDSGIKIIDAEFVVKQLKNTLKIFGIDVEGIKKKMEIFKTSLKDKKNEVKKAIDKTNFIFKSINNLEGKEIHKKIQNIKDGITPMEFICDINNNGSFFNKNIKQLSIKAIVKVKMSGDTPIIHIAYTPGNKAPSIIKFGSDYINITSRIRYNMYSDDFTRSKIEKVLNDKGTPDDIKEFLNNELEDVTEEGKKLCNIYNEDILKFLKIMQEDILPSNVKTMLNILVLTLDEQDVIQYKCDENGQ